MKYLIVANGTIKESSCLLKYIRQSDVVVCADGGVRHLKQINALPDVVIGDLDSIGDDAAEYLGDAAQNRVLLVQHPQKKDASDTELAVLWAIDRGATDITLAGVTGTRMDHTLSNIFMLRTITQRGVRCRVVDDHNEIYMLSNQTPTTSSSVKALESTFPLSSDTIEPSSISVQGVQGDLISIIPVTEKASGVTIHGVEYPLNSATLWLGSSHGVSNVFTGEIAHISLESGIILVMKSSD